MNSTFAHKIRQSRLDAGLTQHDVAQRAGLTERYVNGIENGGPCGIPAARTICRALSLGPPWPAVAFMERYVAKQEREFGIAPADTYAELAQAVKDGGGYLVLDADAVDEAVRGQAK
jgi:transcriptional regulator with XRE-family HTH domain